MTPSMTSRAPLLRLAIVTRFLPHRYPLTRAFNTVPGQKTATLGRIPIITTAQQNPRLNRVVLPAFKPSNQVRAYNNSNCDDCSSFWNCSNCDDCRNCTNCTNCDDCTNCTNCTNCDDCKNCTDCTDCVGLTNAYGVKGVKAGELKRSGGASTGGATSSIWQSQDGGKSYIVSGVYNTGSKLINKSSRWYKRIIGGDGNWRGSYIAKDEAQGKRQDQSIVDNANCTNCENCTNCTNCSNCTNCADCTDCEDCVGLLDAHGLKGVKVYRTSDGEYNITVTGSNGRISSSTLISSALVCHPGTEIHVGGKSIIVNDGSARAGVAEEVLEEVGNYCLGSGDPDDVEISTDRWR